MTVAWRTKADPGTLLEVIQNHGGHKCCCTAAALSDNHGNNTKQFNSRLNYKFVYNEFVILFVAADAVCMTITIIVP